MGCKCCCGGDLEFRDCCKFLPVLQLECCECGNDWSAAANVAIGVLRVRQRFGVQLQISSSDFSLLQFLPIRRLRLRFGVRLRLECELLEVLLLVAALSTHLLFSFTFRCVFSDLVLSDFLNFFELSLWPFSGFFSALSQFLIRSVKCTGCFLFISQLPLTISVLSLSLFTLRILFF